jgi:type IV secretory pathway TrbD component
MAVWALRVGYLGLVVALAGLVALVFGSTSWILASGVIIWLVTVPVTLTCFLLARREVSEPRPRLWSMRLMLIHDSVHAASSAQRSSTAPTVRVSDSRKHR